ncbi:vWA domain-containing protein [Arthrobacter bambusae]|uniref:vWA domain-containing protein n=1 Tax=Arthrobacter bambusae TaxID=1338426 RepID=UPI0027D92D4E|nr:vWA domain-containing protein [Arthrobacter bambusae]
MSLLVAALILAPSLSFGAPAAVANETAPTLVDDFRACVAGGGTTDVLLLVDESSSLQGSDPDNARVASASYLVDQLAKYTTAPTSKLNIAVSVFANRYSQIQPWTPLNAGSLAQVQSSIESLKQHESGMETDYWTALDGARADLAARAASRPDAKSCQTVVWFTDGGINYTVRQNDADKAAYGVSKPFAPQIEITNEDAANQVRQIASNEICRPGGVADQIRSSGVAMFAIGLAGKEADPSDFSFIDTVATGGPSGNAGVCGKLVAPVPGEFHMATDIDSLLFAFDGMSSGSRSIVQETGICQVSACTDHSHRFVLDASTPSVQILAAADVSGMNASILSPSGQLLQLPKQDLGTTANLKSDGNSVNYSWLSDKTVSVSMIAEGTNGWSGLWQLAFTDPVGHSDGKKSKTSIHISGNVKPTWMNEAATPIHVGEKLSGVQFGLVDGSGKTIAPQALLGDVKFTATLEDPQGRSTVVLDSADKRTVGDPVDLDLRGYTVGEGELLLKLVITTAATTASDGTSIPGTLLEPTLVSVPLHFLPPEEFPVPASKVSFGQVEGVPNVTAQLPVSGTGCVWIASDEKPQITASPADLGVTTVALGNATSADSCVSVNGRTSIPITFAAQNAGNGSVNGQIGLMIEPNGEPGKAMHVNVSFTASLAKPLNTTNFLLALVVALLLGPGVPLLLLYGAKWLVCRIPGRSLSAELIPVTVENAQVLRDGQPFGLRPSDLTSLVPMAPGGARSLVAAGIELKARQGISPFGRGFVQLVAPGRVSRGAAAPGTDKRGTKARIPLAVHNNWAVLRDIGSPPQPGYVLILANGDASVEEKEKIEADITRRLPELLGRLNESVGEPPPEASESATTFAGAAGQKDSSSGFSGFATGESQVAAVPTRTQAPPTANPPHREDPDSDPERYSPWGTPRS